MLFRSFAARIDHHRHSIVDEAVAIETCDVAIDGPTRFDRMNVQRSDARGHDARESRTLQRREQRP